MDDRQQSLFHPHALTIRWGRKPEGGREKQFYFSSEKEKNAKIRTLLKAKLKDYQVLYSYFKDSAESGSSSGTKGDGDSLVSRIS